jgi:hypothetical protein
MLASYFTPVGVDPQMVDDYIRMALESGLSVELHDRDVDGEGWHSYHLMGTLEQAYKLHNTDGHLLEFRESRTQYMIRALEDECWTMSDATHLRNTVSSHPTAKHLRSV